MVIDTVRWRASAGFVVFKGRVSLAIPHFGLEIGKEEGGRRLVVSKRTEVTRSSL